MPRFSNAFQSHMVLQRGRPLRLWGFGAGSGSSLSVALRPGEMDLDLPGMEARAVADEQGRWEATLATPPDAATGKSLTLSVARVGANYSSQELLDVTLGDVYLFTGQSNVDLPESYALQFHPHSQRAEEEFAQEMGGRGLIRIMIVPNQVPGLHYGREPAAELTNSPDCRLCPPPFGPEWDHAYKVCHCNSLRWARASPASMRAFSALGWFSGAALARTLPLLAGVPLGLVRSSWGGTKILRWSGPDAVKQCPQSGKPTGLYTDLFSNMIYPMARLEFSAVVWMHGASDTGGVAPFLGPSYYACALPAMIRDWREKFQRPALPFIVVELPAYCNERDWATFHTFCDQKKSILRSTEYHLPAMRIAQAAAEKLPSVYMVTAMDLGSLHPMGGSIHSDRKQELGMRVAMAARAAVYGEHEIIWEAPRALYASLLQPLHISVSFSTRSNEFLVLNNSARCPPEVLPIYCTGGGFELFSNGTWVPAVSAWLGQNKSVVLRTSIQTPIKRVRYAFADWPVCNLRSAVTGLPARIFDLPVQESRAEPVAPLRQEKHAAVAPAPPALAPAPDPAPAPPASKKYLDAMGKDIAYLEKDAQQMEHRVQPSLSRAMAVVKEKGQEGLEKGQEGLEKGEEGLSEAERYVLPHWPVASLAALAFLGTLCVVWHAATGEEKRGDGNSPRGGRCRGVLEPRTLSRARVLEATSEDSSSNGPLKALLSPQSSCSGTCTGRAPDEDAYMSLPETAAKINSIALQEFEEPFALEQSI